MTKVQNENHILEMNNLDFKTVSKNIPECVIGMDLDKRITIFNKAAEILTGMSENQVIGEKCCDIIKSNACKNSCLFTISLKENRTISRDDVFIEKGNQKVPVCLNVTPLKNVKGQVVGVLKTLIDRTEMKRLYDLEKANIVNADQKRRFEAVVNNISEGIIVLDNDGRVTSLNLSAETITGRNEQETLGKPFNYLFSTDMLGPWAEIREGLLKGNNISSIEMNITSRDGKRIPISLSLDLLQDNRGNIIGYVTTFRDLTEINELNKEIRDRYDFSNIISKNHRMREIFDLIETISDCDVSVLIQGESGTGKELIAHAIHNHSQRRDRPFIVLNCGAISEALLESELFGHVKGAFSGAYRDKIGRFEAAHEGTLFLDEIGDISINMQVKLLRVLQTGEFERVGDNDSVQVDVRIIAATNKNLSDEIMKGNFREDLFYRLNVIPVFLPALRERVEDIPLLVQQFITMFNRKNKRNIKEVSSNVMGLFMNYDWPGNIRELKNIIECSLVCTKTTTIEESSMPIYIRDKSDAKEKADRSDPASEKERIISVLKGCMGNKTITSRMLNMDRTTLWRKIKKYGISQYSHED